MGHEVTIGGERLGTGNKMKTYLRDYERSTHDRSYIWRSTMAAGTLVPFMNEVALPGDTFDIELALDIMTHPTVGPLFGKYKAQLDIFETAIRLYNGKMQMNMLGIGMDMSKVSLPQMEMQADAFNKSVAPDIQQINPSSIFHYQGIKGLGYSSVANAPVTRRFNAVPWLIYWDTYKNYYANKQEEIGAVIHKSTTPPEFAMTDAIIGPATQILDLPLNPTPPYSYANSQFNEATQLVITGTDLSSNVDPSQFVLFIKEGTTEMVVQAGTVFIDWEIIPSTNTIIASNPQAIYKYNTYGYAGIQYNATLTPILETEPKIETFPLSNIDEMRKLLLKWSDDTQFVITNEQPQVGGNPLTPYCWALEFTEQPDLSIVYSKTFSQEGLGLKTYNSDLFNNWLSTEWIDGVDGISEITAIDTSGGSFTIDELNMSKKIYDMLNRIAISGGSFDDWQEAVYSHKPNLDAKGPVYLGSLIQEVVFQEVISNAETPTQPLGSLAGRGRLGQKRIGGKVIARINEPSYLTGIVSLTPIIDYSQGNKWDVNLKTMNDFHKPALDGIGFQDLITDQMAWWDTKITDTTNVITFKSAGKQPAWINYMTNVNEVHGNFADANQQMFMTLNRRYTPRYPDAIVTTIDDLTTYIDPTKFNHIFADTRLDAQNFWVQIGVNIEYRGKISAKIIPNL